jgi:endonuclease/exonuclease/phosphatase family metal-dependent hydrolase
MKNKNAMKNTHFWLTIATLVLLASTACAEAPLHLNVASYNLRYDTPSDDLTDAWSYRKEAVKNLIRQHDFDIVGTQEGLAHQLRDIGELQGYAYVGAGRDDGKSAGEHSAIVYKKDKFALLDSGNFWLSETPDKPGKGWDATCCNRICSWAKFREKSSGKTFYFFNVHFDHEGQVARVESGKLMVQKMHEIAQAEPIICTGDFNSTPETEQVKQLSTFLRDARQQSEVPPAGPEETFNTRFADPLQYRIDYIFVSQHFKVNRYATLTDTRDGGHYPSDHLPVEADLGI